MDTADALSRSRCRERRLKNKIWRKTIFNMADGILTPCNVACGSGMTCHWIRQVAPVMWQVALRWHATEYAQMSAILEFYIWFRFRPYHPMQSTCHSAPVYEFLCKSNHHRQKKMMSCRFSRWQISAILDFRDLIMGSLNSPRTTSYESSIETIALNCLVFEKITFFCILATDRQTNRQTDEQLQCTKLLSLLRGAAA